MPPADTDEQLLKSASRGDEAAFTELYRRRQGGIFRFALQMTGSAQIAEEVIEAVPGSRLVITGEHGNDTGALQGRLYIEALDARGGVCAADDASMVHAGHFDVVDIGRCASDEPRVLTAPDLLANQRFGFNCSGHPLRSCLRRGGFHRIDDVLISGASAHVSLQPFANFRLGGAGIVGEKLLGGQDHAGRAETALQPVLIPESLL